MTMIMKYLNHKALTVTRQQKDKEKQSARFPIKMIANQGHEVMVNKTSSKNRPPPKKNPNQIGATINNDSTTEPPPEDATLDCLFSVMAL